MVRSGDAADIDNAAATRDVRKRVLHQEQRPAEVGVHGLCEAVRD